MDSNALPTRKNLQLTKQSLTLAQKGHHLLDLKYNALMQELKRAEKSANEIREKLQNLLSAAERFLIVAKMELGQENVSVIWESVPWGNPPTLPPYKINETCVALDQAYVIWQQIFTEQQKLSELEETIISLKSRTHRTRKRVSALRNITIPEYETRAKNITEQLEERERDEMSRLKVARR
ncbi:MAG: V-type ATP synthase subunit D [Defluviitaleaceae bacterium]|nr:V-type ATP synthase subunit D [Defluviitaleaceae bacterium]